MRPLAVFISDLHLQARVPRSRGEDSWFDVMAERLSLLNSYIDSGAAVICAGDVFDHWAPGPELINFAIKHLPKMWSIPGQHDLPGHNYEGRHRGAYHTLALAGRLVDMPPGRVPRAMMPPSLVDAGVSLYAMPWGFDVPVPDDDDTYKILVAHRFVAAGEDTAYPGAPPDAFMLGPIARACEQYDLAVFGDNHKGFSMTLKGHTQVFNHGSFIPRNSDEQDYRPQVGILYSNLKFNVERLVLEGSWRAASMPVTSKEARERDTGYMDYIESCRNLREPPIPFLDRLTRIADKADTGVAKIIRSVREYCNGDDKQSI